MPGGAAHVDSRQDNVHISSVEKQICFLPSTTPKSKLATVRAWGPKLATVRAWGPKATGHGTYHICWFMLHATCLSLVTVDMFYIEIISITVRTLRSLNTYKHDHCGKCRKIKI